MNPQQLWETTTDPWFALYCASKVTMPSKRMACSRCYGDGRAKAGVHWDECSQAIEYLTFKDE